MTTEEHEKNEDSYLNCVIRLTFVNEKKCIVPVAALLLSLTFFIIVECSVNFIAFCRCRLFIAKL